MLHRRFLPKNHQYRKMKGKFDNTVEKDLSPKVLTGTQIYAQLQHLKVVHGKGKFKGKRKGRGKGKGKEIETEESPKAKPVWKRKSIFLKLPYWQYLDVRHCIDGMHVEKNVCDSILGTLLNIKDKTKDSVNA